jgi:hypothetical protein
MEPHLISHNAAVSHQKSAPIGGVWGNRGECRVVDRVSAVPNPFATGQDKLLGVSPGSGAFCSPHDAGDVPVVYSHDGRNVLGPIACRVPGYDFGAGVVGYNVSHGGDFTPIHIERQL